jgi:phage-related protein
LRIIDYHATGGKNVIKEYLSSLPKDELVQGYAIRHRIVEKGISAFQELDTRQLRGKLWEIKFSKNRIMYIIANEEEVNFLHACKKQKDKAEQFELATAMRRAKECGFDI